VFLSASVICSEHRLLNTADSEFAKCVINLTLLRNP